MTSEQADRIITLLEAILMIVDEEKDEIKGFHSGEVCLSLSDN
jgi:hypothetical protein